jgi:pyruvate/2-oxoglutarate dehydrogenase complex dihydrolipoamide acyltransferase (E2) component
MTTRIRVPHLDANTIDVTVTAWLKRPGECVAAGETIAELTTDKAAFDLEAPASGTLLAILAAPKSIVPSGYVIGVIGDPGASDPAAEADNAALLAAYRAATGAAPAAAAAPVAPPAAARVRATPKARRLAQQHGIDLARVQAETGVEVVDEAALALYLKT